MILANIAKPKVLVLLQARAVLVSIAAEMLLKRPLRYLVQITISVHALLATTVQAELKDLSKFLAA